ncbi:MAG: bifunctional folylpolyglutamate synthase/dihydrofolate synthase [Chlorobi bacterium]|nr:bifunctional folylpolyglutamate synthase/dihydrofolate synthase [Chlorobiota bacterium]
MKTYEDVLRWMYSKLPMYQRVGEKAVKKDLRNISLLAEEMKHPEKRYPSVHIAGTNGKGSVAHMLASVLMEAGYTVGLYTSPHLKDFRERIKVNGVPVRKKFVIGFIKRYKDFIEKHGLSFFEMTVGMAFQYFWKNRVDIAIIEAGLGGRLDSTNIITPVLCIITNVQKDHTDMLGETYEEIAREKAGIIKPGIPVIVGEMPPEALEVIREVARENASEIIYPTVDPDLYETDLKGPYQKKNLQLVLEAVNHLRVIGFGISERRMREGLMKVKENTGFRGRWDIVSEHPLILFDTAHNPAAMEIVMDEIKKMPVEDKHMVLGFVKGKDVCAMLDFMPEDAYYYISEAQVPRAMPKEEVADYLKKMGKKYATYDTLSEAFEAAKMKAGPDDLIFVGGSTYTVGELI